MKIHRHIIFEVFDSLKNIFLENQYADKVIERCLKGHKKWGSRDRKFFAETTYDLVRHWRYLWALIEEDPSNEDEKLWKLYAAYLVIKGQEFPEWEEFSKFKTEDILKRKEALQGQRAIRESLPDDLDELCFKQLGEEWEPLLKSLNQKAPVILRTNTLKITREDLLHKLIDEEVDVGTLRKYPHALKLKKRKNVFITDSFKKGYFEVQDASSQKVSAYLDLEPGQRVIDACAGAGGKTLAIASELKNKGRIIALDIHQWKLGELKKRARRAGVDIVETRVIESGKTVKRLAESADRLLLDVPCSGLGVLRRNPDSKWKLNLERIEEMQKLQRDILSRYSKMLKPGGLMVYSTCSVLPSENEEQVQWFLDQNSGWEKVSERTFYPHKDEGDGFYICSIKKS